MRKRVIGLLAHVDAGKTTLSEAILFNTNSIKKIGRVDHEDSFLDYNDYERKKGITILSKPARFSINDNDYILLDTPGHLDFYGEVERSIKILDIAILIIDARKEIPSDIIRQYKNLSTLQIPTIIFINKMDISERNKEELINIIKDKLGQHLVDINNFEEAIALDNEEYLDSFIKGNKLPEELIYESLIYHLNIPIFFGSALKNEGINDLLNFIKQIKIPEINNDKLKAYIYKIDKYTNIKVLSGILKNKMSFNNEKIDEIYLLNGQEKISVQEVYPGDICAVNGLKELKVGTYLPSLFIENTNKIPSLDYALEFKENINEVIKKIQELNEEFPELNIHIENNQIMISLLGELQADYIKELIKDRYDIEIKYSKPIIKYKESIRKESIAGGHFEPLKHYGEVIIKLKPNDSYKVKSSLKDSDTNNLISYLNEFRPKGILTNSILDNIEIEILAIKKHIKHTKGQDIIEAASRAIRNALIKNDNYLLSPHFITTFICSQENKNIILKELIQNNYSYDIEEDSLIAKIPKNDFNDFILLMSQKLKDELSYQINGEIYDEERNYEKIIDEFNYDYLNDRHNPCGSIFQIGGQTYIEPQDVDKYLHIDINQFLDKESSVIRHNRYHVSEEELKKIWQSLYRPKVFKEKKEKKMDDDVREREIDLNKELLYFIDGYNLMHSIEDMPLDNLTMAREKLIDIVCDFAGYTSAKTILVFDAYMANSPKENISEVANITVVYTKKNETADTYIEKRCKILGDKYRISVVSSDSLEQLRIFSSNARRISSREFMMIYKNFKKNNLEEYKPLTYRPFENLKELLEEDD